MPTQAISCLQMRGGTSKGVYLLAGDLPEETRMRDRLLLGIMGSPDPRQIDGLGGGDSLTSKVAIIAPSDRADCDVEYLFAQVSVDQPIVDTSANCGNILSGVAPFAILRGLVQPADPETLVRIHNTNTDSRIHAHVRTPSGASSSKAGPASTACREPRPRSCSSSSMCWVR